jgi:hypothetical protein
MSWDSKKHRWVKMVKGNRLTVACSTLAAQYGNLPEQDWTKEGSYQLANRWLAERLGKEQPASELDRQIDWAMRNDPELAKELNARKKAERSPDDGDIALTLEIAREQGIIIPDDLDPAILRELFGNAQIWQDRFSRDETPSKANSLPACVDEFLTLLRDKGAKARTYKEIADMLTVVKAWWGNLDVGKIDEGKVTDAYKRVAAMPVETNTKRKRWGFFKRFVKYLFESGKVALPRNLQSRLLNFKGQYKEVKTYPLETVKSELAKLPDKLRLYALLGLNCGMTNTDISALRHDMIVGDYLIRKRVKTGDNANVPTVAYHLWTETMALLNQFKSNHPSFWLTTSKGTPLVGTRMEGEKVKTNDQISLRWQKYGKCPITPSKFRNIAATLLNEHENYGRYKEHFLAHSPKSIADKHYAAPSQAVFDSALAWLHEKVFGSE